MLNKLLKRSAALLVLVLCLVPITGATSTMQGGCSFMWDNYLWQEGYGITMIMHGGQALSWGSPDWISIMQGNRSNYHAWVDLPDTNTHHYTELQWDHNRFDECLP